MPVSKGPGSVIHLQLKKQKSSGGEGMKRIWYGHATEEQRTNILNPVTEELKRASEFYKEGIKVEDQ
jgi:hypothetical protein